MLHKQIRLSIVSLMNITVTGHKGGVGKTVTAIHLAAYLSELHGPESTLVIDGDPNRSALEWSRPGRLPFAVGTPKDSAGAMAGKEHIVLDTQGRPSREVLEGLVSRCDLLVIPSMTDPLSIKALMLLVGDLRAIRESAEYRVLLTNVPPWPSRSGAKAKGALESHGVPLFDGHIRRRVAFERAALSGVAIKDVNEKRAGDGWEDYVKVGREIVA